MSAASGCHDRARIVVARRTHSRFLRWPRLRKVLETLLRDHGARGTVSVAIVGDGEMREIHRRFLGADEATDVLSFRLDSACPGPHDDTFGEIVVSAETALREARKRGRAPERELALYAIHGALHLVGWDDRAAGDRRKMRLMERKYMRRLL